MGGQTFRAFHFRQVLACNVICFEAQPQNSKCLTSSGNLNTPCRSEYKFSGDCYLLLTPGPTEQLGTLPFLM